MTVTSPSTLKTHPQIPYTLTIHPTHLLLTPRLISTPHRKFPPLPSTQPLPHLTLQLNAYLAPEFRRRYNRDPQFSAEWVDFGYEEESDEVVVMAWLEGTDYVAHWAFGRLLEGDGRHALESGCPEEEAVGEGAEEAREIFGGMRWELAAQGNAS